MWNVVKSVLAAFFGVQKESRRRADFTRGRPGAFVGVGVLMTLLLVIVVSAVAMLAAR